MRANNHAKRWTEVDVARLALNFAQNTPLKDICELLGRTAGGICGKLKEIGFLSHEENNSYMRKETKQVYVSYHELRRIDNWMRDIDPNAPWEEFF